MNRHIWQWAMLVMGRSSALAPLATAALAGVFLLGTAAPVRALALTWNNSNTDGLWDTSGNWTGTATKPAAGDDVTLPTPIPAGGGTLALTAGELAKTLTFNDIYLLTGGTLTLGTSGNTVTVAPAMTGTINTPIIGNSVVTKAGGGTLVLGGANGYTGATSVSAGLLRLGSGASLAGTTLNVTGSGSFDLGGNDVLGMTTFTNTSSSVDSITNSGLAATFTLANNGGTFSGGFSGALSVNIKNSANNNMTVSSNFTNVGNVALVTNNTNYTNSVTLSGSVNNAGTITNAAITGGATYVISGTIGSNVTDIIQSSGSTTLSLTKANSYTGSTTANAGALLLDFSAAGAPAANIAPSGSALALGGGTLSVKGNTVGTFSQTFADLSLAAQKMNGIIVNKNGSTGTALAFTNTVWARGADSGLFVDLSGGGTLQAPTGAAGTLTNGILPWVAVKDAATGFGTISGGNVVRYTSATTLTDIVTTATTNYKLAASLSLTLPNGASRTLNSLEISTGATGTLTIPVGVTLAPTAIVVDASYTITAPGKLGADNANLIINVNSGRTLTVNNNISGGTGSLTFLGSGTLQLENAQSFTGTTVIAGGTLSLNSNPGSANLASATIVNNGVLNLAGNADRTLVGNISGAGSITRTSTWAYIWTLAGNNSYTGVTTLKASNTVITSNTALGSATTGTSVGTNSLTDFTAQPATLGLSGSITSAEPLTIMGAGATAQIPAAWAGTTGVLRNVVGDNTLTGPVTLAGASTIYAAAGSLTFAGGITGATRTLTVDGPGATNLSSFTSDVNLAGITKVGPGNLTLDFANMATPTNMVSATTALTLGGGTFTVEGLTGANLTAQTFASLTLNTGPSHIVIDPNGGTSTTLTMTSNTLTRALPGAVHFDTSAGTPSTAIIAWNPTLTGGIIGGAYTITDNSGTGFATVSGGQVVRLTGATVLTAGNPTSATTDFLTNASVTNTVAPTAQLNSLTIDTTGGVYAWDLGGNTAAVTTGGLVMTGANDYSIGNGSLKSLTATNSDLTVNQHGTGVLTIGAAIVNGNGASTLTKTGAGTLVLSADNSYTGTTCISEGALQVGNGGATGNLAGNVANSTTNALVFNRTTDATYAGVISGVGGVTVGGTGAIILTNANTYTGGTTINPGATLQLGNAGTTGSVSGTITNAGTLIWSRSNATGFTNTLTGAGSLILTGGGDYSINIGNTSGWTGSTTIKSGTTVTASQVSAFGQLATAPLTIESGATVKMTGSAGIYLTPITMSGTGVNGLGAIYGNVANPFLTGLVTLAADTTVRNDNSGATLFFDGDVADVGLTGAGTLTLMGAGGFKFNSVAANDNNRGLIADGTGVVNLTVKGPGTTTINPNANTFTGVVTIDGGTLSVYKLANIGSNSSIGQGVATSTATNRASLVFGGGTLAYAQNTNVSTDRLFTLGDASGLTGAISNTSGSYLKFTNTNEIGYGGSGARALTLTGTSTAVNDFAPLIGNGAGGATALVKSGTGTWNLTNPAALTYTGGTTVTGGNLTVAAATTLGANAAGNDVLIANDGKLTLNAAANMGGSQRFNFRLPAAPTTNYLNGALPVLIVNHTSALPAYLTGGNLAAGVVALNVSYATGLDQSALGDSFLGANSAVNYSASALTPGSDGIYRLGGGGSALTLTNTGAVLTGTGVQLIVGPAGYNGLAPSSPVAAGVILQGANDYTGATRVNPGSTLTVSGVSGSIAGSSGITAINSTLTLDNASGNVNRIADTAGVTLERSTLTLAPNTTTNTTETIGTLTLTTNATATLTTAALRVTTLAASGIARTGVATGLIRGTSLGGNGAATNITRVTLGSPTGLNLLGTNDANTATGTSSVTNQKISPWLLADTSSSGTGSNFATYDAGATGGIRPLSSGETVTFAAKSANDQNVRDVGNALTVASAQTMNSLVLAPTAGATLVGGGTGSLTITSGGLALVTNFTEALSGFTGITIGNATEAEAIIHTGTGTLTISSPINAGLDYGLTKAGGGTVTLATAQTFTGAIVVNAGTLNINASSTQSSTTINGGTLSLNFNSTNALGSGSAAININSGGTLVVNNYNLSNQPVDNNLGGGNIYLNDGGTISLTGGGGTRKVFSNTVVVTGNGYLKQDSGGGSGNKTRIMGISMSPGAMLTTYRSNGSTNGFGTGVVTLNEASASGNATFNVLSVSSSDSKATDFFTIAGTGGIVKLGAAQLWLGYSGYFVTGEVATACTYTGDTRIEEGLLRIGMNNCLPTGTTLYVNTGGTFDLSIGGYENDTGRTNYNQQVAGINDGSAGGGRVTADTVGSGSMGARTLTLGGGGAYAFSGILSDNTTGSSGRLALTKSGIGTQALSGLSSYTGVTTLSGGVLSVGNLANGGSASAIGASTNAAANLLLNGGTLQYTGAAAATDRLFTLTNNGGTLDASGAANAALTISGNGVGPANAVAFSGSGTRTLTLTGPSTGANTFAPVLGDGTGGATSLAKTGLGTWLLNAANTYTGQTNVTTGMLLANNAGGSATGSGPVIVGLNGTLGGIGTIAPGGANGVTVNGTVAPGASIGMLTFDLGSTTGGVAFASGAALTYELGAPVSGDQIRFLNYNPGDLIFNNNTINFVDVGGLDVGTYVLFSFYADAGSTPTAHGLTSGLVIGSGLPPERMGSLLFRETDIALSLNEFVIPEPATLALLGLAGLCVLRRTRRS